MADRIAYIERKTNETDIKLELHIDGTGQTKIDTGIGFFDHMLNSFARHGFFDLKLLVKGDLYVDSHHTIEDTGIVLGQAIKKALGDKKGIKRYGQRILPMDETLMLCSLDLSGRPYFSYDMNLTVDQVGYFDTEMVKEFFYAVSCIDQYILRNRLKYRKEPRKFSRLIHGFSTADGKSVYFMTLRNSFYQS